MSAAFVFKVISITVFIVSMNAKVWKPSRSCYPRDQGIESIERSPDNIPGRYELKICNFITNHLVEFGTLFVHVEYVGENCHFTPHQKPVLHSMLEKMLDDLHKCPVVCQDISLDLMANGCYNITFGIVDTGFNLLSEHISTQYIKDSKDLQYFNTRPIVSILYDHRDYIDITWNSGHIPITSYTVSVCPSKNFNIYTGLEHCNFLDFCDNLLPYSITCISNKPKEVFGFLEPQLLVFKHKDVPWSSGMFRGLTTAIYKLDRSFDLNRSNIISGTATYLTPKPTESEVNTATEITSESESTSAITIIDRTNTKTIEDVMKKEIGSPSTEGEAKSGGGGLIVVCVVIGVLILVMALVLRTLHVRGHFRRYFNLRS